MISFSRELGVDHLGDNIKSDYLGKYLFRISLKGLSAFLNEVENENTALVDVLDVLPHLHLQLRPNVNVLLLGLLVYLLLLLILDLGGVLDHPQHDVFVDLSTTEHHVDISEWVLPFFFNNFSIFTNLNIFSRIFLTCQTLQSWIKV